MLVRLPRRLPRRLALAASLVLLAAAATACSDDAGGTPDAHPSGPCTGEAFLSGDLLDLDALAGGFVGINGAVWTVEGDAARTHTTPPNGRVELCVAAGTRVNVLVDAPGAYLDGRYVAESRLFGTDSTFSVYGATKVQLDTLYATFDGLRLDTTKAQLLVEVKGVPRAVSLTGATPAAVRYFTAARTWDATGPGAYVLFANVEPGTATVSMSGSVGGGAVRLDAGAWAMTTLLGQ